jgi:hypothetical protein
MKIAYSPDADILTIRLREGRPADSRPRPLRPLRPRLPAPPLRQAGAVQTNVVSRARGGARSLDRKRRTMSDEG